MRSKIELYKLDCREAGCLSHEIQPSQIFMSHHLVCIKRCSNVIKNMLTFGVFCGFDEGFGSVFDYSLSYFVFQIFLPMSKHT